jgi:glycosyltransferase involved in cell wall biosynthesis
MRVAIISDSPSLPTGFARTTRSLAKALVDTGHEVSCYGLGIFGEVFDRTHYPCKIWPAGDNDEKLREMFLPFVVSEKPDAILINYDLMTTLSWMRFLTKSVAGVEIISHLIIDGLPVYPELLKPLNVCAAIIVVTQCAQAQVAAAVSAPVYYLPHMVDCEKFRPLKNAETVKRTLFADSFVIGTVAQNRSRKQLVQTLHAIRLLRDAGRKPVFLLHTDRVRGLRVGGKPLRKIVEYFGIEDIVHITESHHKADAAAEDATAISSRFGDSLQVHELHALTVAERLNLCDVAVVASAFGGFEYGIIEAQSCGIPVCVTDDDGNMMEVAGRACEPLRPAFFEFTDYGAKVWKLSPETIATAIAQMMDNPQRRQELQASGAQNARRYDLAMNESRIAATLDQILDSLLRSRRKFERAMRR